MQAPEALGVADRSAYAVFSSIALALQFADAFAEWVLAQGKSREYLMKRSSWLLVLAVVGSVLIYVERRISSLWAFWCLLQVSILSTHIIQVGSLANLEMEVAETNRL